MGYISKADADPICVHHFFAVPNAMGGGFRNIIDCSTPGGRSVNKFVNEMSSKFSYLGG